MSTIPQLNGRARLRRGLCFVIAFAILIGIFFRFYNISHKTFWEDEIIGTVRMLGYTEAEIVKAAPTFHTARDIQRFSRCETFERWGARSRCNHKIADIGGSATHSNLLHRQSFVGRTCRDLSRGTTDDVCRLRRVRPRYDVFARARAI